MKEGPSPWRDAVLAAALFAVDPNRVGGLSVKALPGPVRDTWMAHLHELLGSIRSHRLPVHVTDDRLIGGLDLAATLHAGRPIAEAGILATADGGALLISMAERLEPMTSARLTSVMDSGEVRVERDGIGERYPSRFGVVAIDESVSEEEAVAASLLERLAFRVDLEGVSIGELEDAQWRAADVMAARRRLSNVEPDDVSITALCKTAAALGILSARAPMLALRAACVAAALMGRSQLTEADIVTAGRLVLAPRALVLPPDTAEPQPEQSPEPEEPKASADEEQADPERNANAEALDDVVLAATESAIPPKLLMRLRSVDGLRRRSSAAGKSNLLGNSLKIGRPVGVRPGDPGNGKRLSVLDTLRAAAPWQRLRGQETGDRGASLPRRLQIRRSDFRVKRFKQREQTTTIFVVDASGSAALHRLAEAKGAVECLLADCYVRRDQVAVLVFRGQGTELVLPPTRSLARAKRCLAGVPGGGGTPLAGAVDAARALGESVRRTDSVPLVVMLTDGRANIARDGTGGRSRAEADSLASAHLFRATGIASIVVDTAPRPSPNAAKLATDMGALYMPLPHLDAAGVSKTVQRASQELRGGRLSAA